MRKLTVANIKDIIEVNSDSGGDMVRIGESTCETLFGDVVERGETRTYYIVSGDVAEFELQCHGAGVKHIDPQWDGGSGMLPTSMAHQLSDIIPHGETRRVTAIVHPAETPVAPEPPPKPKCGWFEHKGERYTVCDTFEDGYNDQPYVVTPEVRTAEYGLSRWQSPRSLSMEGIEITWYGEEA